jgi:hypothetical protein
MKAIAHMVRDFGQGDPEAALVRLEHFREATHL